MPNYKIAVPLGIADGPEASKLLFIQNTKDCKIGQLPREIVLNGVEACIRWLEKNPLDAGKMQVTVEQFQDLDENRNPVLRWRISDNGEGIPRSKFIDLTSKMLGSGKQQGLTKNFGVGLKVCLKFSPHGTEIASMTSAGASTYGKLAIDDSTGAMGIIAISGQQDDGTPSEMEIAAVDDEDRELDPNNVMFQGNHGTMVTLHGGHPDLDGLNNFKMWRLLSDRFFRLDPRVRVMVDDRDRRRTLHSHEMQCKAAAQAHGTVQLSGAKAHWYINQSPRTGEAGYAYVAFGVVGLVWGNEVYQIYSKPDSARLLRHAGCSCGVERQVRVIFEIEDESVTPDLSRTRLTSTKTSDIDDLVHQWVAEFKDNLPEEIKAANAEMSLSFDKRNSEDKQRKMEDMLKKLRMENSVFKKTSKGRDKAVGPVDEPEPFPDTEQWQEERKEKRQRTYEGRRKKMRRSVNPDKNDSVSKTGRKNSLATVYWVAEPTEGTECYPAVFDVGINTIIMNEQYNHYVNELSCWKERYPDEDEKVIKNIVQFYFEWVIQQVVVSWRELQSRDMDTLLNYESRQRVIEGSAFVAAVFGSSAYLRDSIGKELHKNCLAEALT
jgi:hypothetical protein